MYMIMYIKREMKVGLLGTVESTGGREEIRWEEIMEIEGKTLL